MSSYDHIMARGQSDQSSQALNTDTLHSSFNVVVDVKEREIL